jgi:hypothetical protein
LRRQHGVPRLATTEARTEEQRQDELVKIEKYHELERLIQSKVDIYTSPFKSRSY